MSVGGCSAGLTSRTGRSARATRERAALSSSDLFTQSERHPLLFPPGRPPIPVAPRPATAATLTGSIRREFTARGLNSVSKPSQSGGRSLRTTLMSPLSSARSISRLTPQCQTNLIDVSPLYETFLTNDKAGSTLRRQTSYDATFDSEKVGDAVRIIADVRITVLINLGSSATDRAHGEACRLNGRVPLSVLPRWSSDLQAAEVLLELPSLLLGTIP
jgi:hypothetical protein